MAMPWDFQPVQGDIAGMTDAIILIQKLYLASLWV